LGIEAARLYITQDSVYFMNRLKNEYATSSFGFFKKQFQVDLDFNTLQSLLTGNSINTLGNQQHKLQVNYSNFGNIEGQPFPQRLSMEAFIQAAEKSQKYTIDVNYSKIELNKEVSVPFNIPDKYKRITL